MEMNLKLAIVGGLVFVTLGLLIGYLALYNKQINNKKQKRKLLDPHKFLKTVSITVVILSLVVMAIPAPAKGSGGMDSIPGESNNNDIVQSINVLIKVTDITEKQKNDLNKEIIEAQINANIIYQTSEDKESENYHIVVTDDRITLNHYFGDGFQNNDDLNTLILILDEFFNK